MCSIMQASGIRLAEGGFQSEMAASFAGKRALAEFLNALSKKDARAGKWDVALWHNVA
jgi:hypothetical protein